MTPKVQISRGLLVLAMCAGGTWYRTVDVLQNWLMSRTPQAAIAGPGALECP